MGALGTHPDHEPFLRFRRAHAENNHFVFALATATYVATDLTQDAPAKEPVSTIYPRNRRAVRADIQRRYRGDTKSTVSIAQWRTDCYRALRHLYEAAIIREVMALEIFVLRWGKRFIQAELGDPASTEERHGLEKLLQELLNPRSKVNLRRVARDVQKVAHHLDLGPGVRRSRMSRRPGEPSVFETVDVWREVRHLLVHHGGDVHEGFISSVNRTWALMRSHALATRPSSAALFMPLISGMHLTIRPQHQVFCFTACYQAADILNEMWPGTSAAPTLPE